MARVCIKSFGARMYAMGEPVIKCARTLASRRTHTNARKCGGSHVWRIYHPFTIKYYAQTRADVGDIDQHEYQHTSAPLLGAINAVAGLNFSVACARSCHVCAKFSGGAGRLSQHRLYHHSQFHISCIAVFSRMSAAESERFVVDPLAISIIHLNVSRMWCVIIATVCR